MNLHLYYCPGTCSFVPHALLELAKETNGQDFASTMITLRNGEHLKPEYQAINPRSQVPALIVDGQLVTQVVAHHQLLERSIPESQDPPERPHGKSASSFHACLDEQHGSSNLHQGFQIGALWR